MKSLKPANQDFITKKILSLEDKENQNNLNNNKPSEAYFLPIETDKK